MKVLRKKRQKEENNKMHHTFVNFVSVMIFLLLISAFYLVMSFKPLTKEEQINKYNKMNEEVEPFRKNLTECARQVKASMVDVENFLKRVPASTMQGKCFVACILKRNSIIKNNKIMKDKLIEENLIVYGQDSEVLSRLRLAVDECTTLTKDIFEICEFASMFNDCMHMKMEHILDKVTMERRMEALGQMASDPDEWTEDEEELLKLIRDEL